MFTLKEPTDREIERRIVAASLPETMKPEYLDDWSGLRAIGLPNGFMMDRLRTRIGEGPGVFDRAIQAFQSWTQFDVGWARVANALTPIEIGRIVALEVHCFGLWTVNLSQIVQVMQTANHFGFIYKTTAHHVEEGEERFLLMLDERSGVVWYEMEAVSRPRHLLALMSYPVTRRLQHQFARESHRRMAEAVDAGTRE